MIVTFATMTASTAWAQLAAPGTGAAAGIPGSPGISALPPSSVAPLPSSSLTPLPQPSVAPLPQSSVAPLPQSALAPLPLGSTVAPTGSTPFGTSNMPPSTLGSPTIGTTPPNNLQLPATTSSSAYQNGLPLSSVSPPPSMTTPTPPPAAPPTANTLGGVTVQPGNPNPTIGGLPTTTP